jgi:hypothetical protein
MLNMKWTLSAALLAASLATAQSPSYRGSFTLPCEARFGNTVLQPGKYSVSAIEGAKGITISGDKQSVSLLSAGFDFAPEATNSKLILVDVGGEYTLKTFESASMGKTMHFSVSKSRGNTERAGARPNIEVGMP